MSEAGEGMSIEARLIRAARRILRPLVRILLRNGITAQSLEELVRKTYVDVAYEEFAPEYKKQTVANVSVLTGLNRKEVARLHKLEVITDEDKAGWTRAGKVLDGWLTDKAFHSEAGFPLDLPFAESPGLEPSFTALVKTYSGDMYPTPLRDELLRVGALIEVDGALRMTKRGYVPATDEGAKIDIFGVDTAEMMDTIDFNISSDDASLLQYKVLADNLPADQVEEFNEFSRRVSLSAIDEIRHWLIEHDAGSSVEGERFYAGVGVYQINRVRVPPTSNKGSKDE